jgi:large subunit ribosomal protein L21
MYVIAKIAGKQFRLEPDARVQVPRLKLDEGATYDVEEILLAVDSGGTRIGTDALKGIKAKTKVVSHGREPKVVVFRKKRRKGFKVTKGHRQGFTLLQVEKIEGMTSKTAPAEKSTKKAAPKKAAKPKASTEAKKTAKKQEKPKGE